MEKFIVNDGTFIEIQKGAYLGKICAVVNEFSELERVASILSKEGNLDKVQFMSENIAGAQYENMVLESPMFNFVDKENGKVVAAFSLRQITEEEKQTEKNKAQVQTAIEYLNDEQALTVKELYPIWSGNSIDYTAGDRVLYMDSLYKCLQAHTSQGTWAPDAAPSLWAKILIPDPEVISEWEQPDSTNGYSIGDKVTHNNKTWKSLVDDNVWEPGAEGTESLWKEVVE